MFSSRFIANGNIVVARFRGMSSRQEMIRVPFLTTDRGIDMPRRMDREVDVPMPVETQTIDLVWRTLRARSVGDFPEEAQPDLEYLGGAQAYELGVWQVVGDMTQATRMPGFALTDVGAIRLFAGGSSSSDMLRTAQEADSSSDAGMARDQGMRQALRERDNARRVAEVKSAAMLKLCKALNGQQHLTEEAITGIFRTVGLTANSEAMFSLRRFMLSDAPAGDTTDRMIDLDEA